MTAPVTPEVLDELERLLACSTDGPWYREDEDVVAYASDKYRIVAHAVGYDDAQLVCTSRRELPALIAATRDRDALAADNARLVARVAELEVALCDAAGQSYDWSAYAGEFLRDKYGAAAETGGWLAKIPRDRLDAIIAAESASPKAARTWADEMLAAHDAREKR